MRILSLLPSATEIAFALGLGADLVGVTHECDWPDEARRIRQVTRRRLPAGASPGEIDRIVHSGSDSPMDGLDREAIAELQPDLVLTQDLCAVCAVPAGHLRTALDALGIDAAVVSLEPSTLDDVLDNILSVGEATGTTDRAEEVVSGLRARLEEVSRRPESQRRPRVLALEWSDPPWSAGHWVPEMIARAGGEALLAEAGAYSRRLTWEEVAQQDPDVVVFMPCGYNLEAAVAEAESIIDRSELAAASRFLVADAAGYFSRPGPRLFDGIEALADSLHGFEAKSDVLATLR